MRSVGSQGVPRWSEPISHHIGPVPPPTILNVTMNHTTTEDDEVEVVVNLVWEMPSFSDLPTPIPNTDSSSYGSGSGDFLEPEIELGSLTDIIGYVGDEKLNDFSNPRNRVMTFKVHIYLHSCLLMHCTYMYQMVHVCIGVHVYSFPLPLHPLPPSRLMKQVVK